MKLNKTLIGAAFGICSLFITQASLLALDKDHPLFKGYKELKHPFLCRCLKEDPDSLTGYSATSNITYKSHKIFPQLMNKPFQVLHALYQRDHQQVNHFFVEMVLVPKQNNEKSQLKRLVLCYDSTKNHIVFAPIEDNYPMVDFVSRSYQEGFSYNLNFATYQLVADKSPLAPYAHSEVLYLALMQEKDELFLKNANLNLEDMEAIIFINYSSLDNCDSCYNSIHAFNEKLKNKLNQLYPYSTPKPYQIVCSIAPCKKTSYLLYQKEGVSSLFFNKKKQVFEKNGKMYPFIQDKMNIDIANMFFDSVHYIHSLEGVR